MTGLEKLLRWHSLRGGISTQDATATGNPATFTTTLVRPLKGCKANFAPVQEGSGTPSPENVRPISGWDGLTVYHSGADTSDPEEIAVTFGTAGTVYGGTVDLVTGVLTVTHKYMDVTTENLPVMNKYSVTGGAFVAQFKMSENNYPKPVASSGLSNRFSQAIDSGPGRINVNVTNDGTNANIYVFLPVSEMSGQNVSDAWAWFSANPTQVVYELATPQTIQIDPQTIRTLAGTNTVWSNANGNLEITYIKKG